MTEKKKLKFDRKVVVSQNPDSDIGLFDIYVSCFIDIANWICPKLDR